MKSIGDQEISDRVSLAARPAPIEAMGAAGCAAIGVDWGAKQMTHCAQVASRRSPRRKFAALTLLLGGACLVLGDVIGPACAEPSSVFVTPARSQAPDAGNISPAEFAVRDWRGQRVEMRDHVRLAADVYQPEAPGRFGAILMFTPYGRAGLRERARYFAARGYVVVTADFRGRYDSDGQFDPFDEVNATDGYDLVEWIAKQGWSNGRVGMMGASFLGWIQWFTARERPPSLKAIVPTVAPPDPFNNIPYQNGLIETPFLDWLANESGRVATPRAAGPYGGWPKTRFADLWHTPYVDINRNRGLLNAPWFEKIYRNNLSTDDYWKGAIYQGEANYRKIIVPSLNITGWFDACFPGSPENYQGMKAYGATPEARRPTLIIGPWIHQVGTRKVGDTDYGPEAAIDLDAYTVRWFDHFLKGLDNGVEHDPPVFVFVTGENKWRAESDWPLPQTQWTKYYLQSGGKANSLNGDGVLTTAPPAQAGADKYVYDPANPTLSPWKSAVLDEGAIDARSPETGKDVLVYTTPPLQQSVEVVGPIEAEIFATTSARDTDWIVHLVDVYPDGYAALLAEGVLRARNRDPANGGAFNPAELSVINAGETYKYTIKFWRGVGNVFAQGHRIRLDISSSYYPYYLRNLNTGADNVALVAESEAVVAQQIVYHSPKYTSFVMLPVIPRKNEEYKAH